MKTQALAILFGTLCAMVLTPWVVALWRQLAPPSEPQRNAVLSAEGWNRSDSISKESAVVTALAALLFVGVVGFGTVVDSVAVIMAISGVFGIPTGWMVLRTRLLAPVSAPDDFARYFEHKHGISFQSWQLVGIPALLISLTCLAVFISQR